MSNPIFERGEYLRSFKEARDFEDHLALRFDDSNIAKRIAQAAGLNALQVVWNVPPASLWAAILDMAAKQGSLMELIQAIEEELSPEPKDPFVRKAIRDLCNLSQPGGRLSLNNLVMSGDRPFLGRANLRSLLPELRNWDSAASILLVQGAPDTGRTETQVILNEGNIDKLVYVNENMPVNSTLRSIWKKAGAAGNPPSLDGERLTTESAIYIDFWSDVKEALDDRDQRMWILFDDLDKGPGRAEVKILAEVLAIRLTDITFQRRFRMAILGYPEPNLPEKVPAIVVREDKTELFDESHVQAFLEFCMKRAGKNFNEQWLKTKASDLCQRASSRAPNTTFHAALNSELRQWYGELQNA